MDAVKIGRLAVVTDGEITITAPVKAVKVNGAAPVFRNVRLTKVQRLTLKAALLNGETVWSGAVCSRATFKTMRLLIEKGMVELVHRNPYYVTRSGRPAFNRSADDIERYYHVVKFTAIGRAVAGIL